MRWLMLEGGGIRRIPYDSTPCNDGYLGLVLYHLSMIDGNESHHYI